MDENSPLSDDIIFERSLICMQHINASQLFTVPLEFPILKRERFNRWYSTSAYFAAFTLIDLPITFLCSFSYVTITYFMTSQPLEINRYVGFLSVSLALCYASQGVGQVGSALLDIKVNRMNHRASFY